MYYITQQAKKFEKVQAKKTREIKKIIFGSFKLFPSSKIDFWSFLKLQKIEFGLKKFRDIDLFDFTSFFFWTGLL